MHRRKTERIEEPAGECNQNLLPERSRCLWKPALNNLLLSRIVLIWLQFISNALLPDFPTDAFKFSGVRQDEFHCFDRFFGWLFGGLARWDSVHFVNIALNGYIFENTLAFFPLFPTILRKLGAVFLVILPVHQHTSIILAGVLLNNACFFATGMVLFSFVRIGHSEMVAFWATVLFAWNPASIFFSSLYTESVYTFATFAMLRILYGQAPLLLRLIGSTLLLTVSIGLRSNGLANAGYIAYFVAVNYVIVRFSTLLDQRSWKNAVRSAGRMVVVLGTLVFLTLLVALAVRRTGDAIADNFCNSTRLHSSDVKLFAKRNHYVLQGQDGNLPWCRSTDRRTTIFPTYYNHIQKKYWNVEFFGYWKLRKLPCFLLAAPAIVSLLLIIADKFRYQPRFLSLLVFSDPFMPMIVHNIVMIGFGITLFNVEILTRMLFSASPLLYIGFALIADRHLKVENQRFSEIRFSVWKKGGMLTTFIYLYFGFYFVCGTVLHVNWGPFT